MALSGFAATMAIMRGHQGCATAKKLDPEKEATSVSTSRAQRVTMQSNKDLEALAEELKILNAHRFIRVHNSWLRLIFFQFVRGLAFGLGTVMGATVLVSLIAWWASQFSFVPILGEWLSQIVDQMEQGR